MPCLVCLQERVGSFSTLSSRDLLSSTLASVDPKLNAQYVSLVELQSTLSKHAQEIGVKERAIAEQKEQFERLDKQKKKFEKAAELEKTVRSEEEEQESGVVIGGGRGRRLGVVVARRTAAVCACLSSRHPPPSSRWCMTLLPAAVASADLPADAPARVCPAQGGGGRGDRLREGVG